MALFQGALLMNGENRISVDVDVHAQIDVPGNVESWAGEITRPGAEELARAGIEPGPRLKLFLQAQAYVDVIMTGPTSFTTASTSRE